MASVEAKIIELHVSGKTYDEIALTLRTGRHRISRAIHLYERTGQIPLPLILGPPRKVTQPIMDFIDIMTIQQPRISGERLAADISNQFHVTLDASSINRTRARLRFRYRPPRHVQKLTGPQKHARFEFCLDMLTYCDETLHKIYFSDESRIVLGSDKQWIWYRRGEGNDEANAAAEKFPPSVMVFAVIGPGYKSRLLLVDGSIDTAKYISNLDELHFIEDLDAMHGFLGWIFQQDGASCHTSAEAIEWIEGNCDMIGNWPANSPDLSPIELLWAVLKRAVEKARPENIADLKRVILEAWDAISQVTIDKLCATFPDRLACCRDMNGESISRELYRLGEDIIEEQMVGGVQRRHIPWTDDDNTLVIQQFVERGPRWTEIAKLLPGRSAIQLKSHWHSVLRHQLANARSAGLGPYSELLGRVSQAPFEQLDIE
jgi:transposase